MTLNNGTIFTSNMNPIPFECQPEDTSMCGAASATMILRAHNKLADQTEIWEALKFPDGKGMSAYRMTNYFLERKLLALAVIAKNPLALLDICSEKNIHVVLLCRPLPETTHGHFMVLVGTDAINVTVHDPDLGPNRKIERSVLLELCEPDIEFLAPQLRVMILVASKDDQRSLCAVCNNERSTVKCIFSGCGFEIPLAFSTVIGCITPSCSGSNVERVICPKCGGQLMF